MHCQASRERLLSFRTIPMLDRKLRIGFRRAGKATDEEFAEIGCARIAVEKGDPALPTPGQAARGRIGYVAEGSDGTFDLFTGGGQDIGLAVYHTRDGHQRDARLARDISDRRTLPRAAPA